MLAPSSHLLVLFQDEALPKMLLVKQLLSDITGIHAEDPAVTRCQVSVITPCLMLLVGGRTFPGPLKEVFQMPSQAIASHLYQFAMGGLGAIAREYAKQEKT